MVAYYTVGFFFLFLSFDGASLRFFRFFLSFDVVERLTDCIWVGLKGVMIISGRRFVLLFSQKLVEGLMKA